MVRFVEGKFLPLRGCRMCDASPASPREDQGQANTLKHQPLGSPDRMGMQTCSRED